MQKLTKLLLCACLFSAGFITHANETYDADLAKKLEADDYGMHKYVIAFLKPGPNRDQDPESAQKIQRAHLDNIMRLAKEGVLVLAGPFYGDSNLQGIFVFDVDSIEEAKKLTESDPAVKAGRLVMELHQWYGSAAVKMIAEVHEQIAKKNP